jgi:hypothetical protein
MVTQRRFVVSEEILQIRFIANVTSVVPVNCCFISNTHVAPRQRNTSMNAKRTLAVRSQNDHQVKVVTSAVVTEQSLRTVEEQQENHTQIDKKMSPKDHVVQRNMQQQRFIHQV